MATSTILRPIERIEDPAVIEQMVAAMEEAERVKETLSSYSCPLKKKSTGTPIT
jgi:uncharacterized ParB-like nuclease family protein